MLSRALPTGLTIAFAAILGFGLHHLFDAFQIVDDAYFYVRYARSLVTEGAVAWNPGGQPDYGPTSLFQVFLLAPSIQAWPQLPALAILLSSVGCAVVFLALLAILVARSAPTGRRGLITAFVFGALAASSLEFCLVATNGMDTTFAAAFVTSLLLGFLWLQRSPTTLRALIVGAVAALGLGVRPDTLLFALGIPCLAWIFERDPQRRRAWLLAAAACGTTVAFELLAAWIYFGRPLPLSFYAKGTDYFSDSMRAMFAQTPRIELLRFGYTTRILLAVLALDIGLAPRRYWQRSAPMEKASLIAAAAFTVYYLLFVLQMVGDHSRFYFPLLGLIAWLAAKSLARLLETSRATLRPRAQCAVAAVALCAALPAVRNLLDHAPAKRALAARIGRFNIAEMVKEDPGSIWFGVNRFATLPASFSMAMTEVGRPGALCPHQQIHDLSGLNAGWILDGGGFSADTFFERAQPDVIYMPFATYERANAELRAHPNFRRDYELHPNLAGTGLAVRRDSAFYEEIRQALRSVR